MVISRLHSSQRPFPHGGVIENWKRPPVMMGFVQEWIFWAGKIFCGVPQICGIVVRQPRAMSRGAAEPIQVTPRGYLSHCDGPGEGAFAASGSMSAHHVACVCPTIRGQPRRFPNALALFVRWSALLLASAGKIYGRHLRYFPPPPPPPFGAAARREWALRFRTRCAGLPICHRKWFWRKGALAMRVPSWRGP